MNHKPDTSFDDICDVFTTACHRAANWKHGYAGAAYRTRLVSAITDLEAAIAAVKFQPEIAEAFNDKALDQLAKVQRAMES